MIRLLPFILGTYLVPWVLYAIWLLVQRRNIFYRSSWRGVPAYFMLIGSSIALLAILLLYTQYDSTPVSQGYTPARVINGVLIPAQ